MHVKRLFGLDADLGMGRMKGSGICRCRPGVGIRQARDAFRVPRRRNLKEKIWIVGGLGPGIDRYARVLEARFDGFEFPFDFKQFFRRGPYARQVVEDGAITAEGLGPIAQPGLFAGGHIRDIEEREDGLQIGEEKADAYAVRIFQEACGPLVHFRALSDQV